MGHWYLFQNQGECFVLLDSKLFQQKWESKTWVQELSWLNDLYDVIQAVSNAPLISFGRLLWSGMTVYQTWESKYARLSQTAIVPLYSTPPPHPTSPTQKWRGVIFSQIYKVSLYPGKELKSIIYNLVRPLCATTKFVPWSPLTVFRCITVNF